MMAISQWRWIICRALLRFRDDRRGQDMIEYALLAASVAVLVGGLFPAGLLPSYLSIWNRVLLVINILTGA